MARCKPKPTMMRIDRLAIDPDVQPRVELDDDAVESYASDMREAGGWGDFPPAVAFEPPEGGTPLLASGFTRIAAAQLAGCREALVEVRVGGRREASRFALRANRKNGVRLNQADRRRAVGRWLDLEPGMKDRAIAREVGCSPTTVGAVRRERAGVQSGQRKHVDAVSAITPTVSKLDRPAADDFGDLDVIPTFDGGRPSGDAPPWAEDVPAAAAPAARLTDAPGPAVTPPVTAQGAPPLSHLAAAHDAIERAVAALREAEAAIRAEVAERGEQGVPTGTLRTAQSVAVRAGLMLQQVGQNVPKSKAAHPAPVPERAPAPAYMHESSAEQFARRADAMDATPAEASDRRVAAAVATLLEFGTPPPEQWLPPSIRIIDGVLSVDGAVTAEQVKAMYPRAGVGANASLRRGRTLDGLWQSVRDFGLRATLSALIRCQRKREAKRRDDGSMPSLLSFLGGLASDAKQARDAGFRVTVPAPAQGGRRGAQVPGEDAFEAAAAKQAAQWGA